MIRYFGFMNHIPFNVSILKSQRNQNFFIFQNTLLQQSLQKRIPYTSFDHIFIETAKELFRKLYSRRMLIRLIGVKISHLVQGVQQLDLFEDTPEMINLYLSMDYIRKRYGIYAIKRAVGIKEILRD